MNKNYFIAAGILLILAFAGLASADWRDWFKSADNNLRLGPSRPTITNALINANECRGDDVCEMNNATIFGELFVSNRAKVSNPDPLGESADLTVQGKIYTSALSLSDSYGGNNGIYELSRYRFKAGLLEGEGNAYVCVNYFGEIFRSNSPCR